VTYGVAPAPPPRVLTCCAGERVGEADPILVCRVLCVGEEHNKYKYDMPSYTPLPVYGSLEHRSTCGEFFFVSGLGALCGKEGHLINQKPKHGSER